MDKNDLFTPEEKNVKKDNNRQVVIISMMIMAVLLIADLYVMTNMAWNLLALIGISVLFLVSTYFFINAILKEIQGSKLRAEEQYEAIAKSGKASYILLKKAYEQLEEMEGNSRNPAEDIITAQKAIAKITINRSKENADALMNSNDKVLEKIFDFEENMGQNQSELLDKHRHMIDDSVRELMIKQQEMASSMKDMEESIKNELLQAISSMQMIQVQPQTVPVQQPIENTMEDSIDFMTEAPVGSIEEELNLGSDLDFGSDLGIGESVVEESFADDLSFGSDLGIGEPVVEESFADDLSFGSDLDLGISEPVIEESFADDLSFGSDLDLGIGEPVVEESFADDLSFESDLDLGISEPVMEESFADDLSFGSDLDLGIGEPVVEESFADDLSFESDLGLGSDLDFGSDLDLGLDLMAEDNSLPEMDAFADVEMAEEPIIEEPIIEEKKPFVPDMSNPNKLMTPEEIAQLIANL